MNIEIRSLNISKKSWVHSLLDEYQKKIGFFKPISIHLIKSEKDFLKGVDAKDFVAILDERGQSFDSHQFAHNMQKIMESGKQSAFFMVGGPFGIPESVKQRANQSLRLSSLVFNQEVALVVLVEQIFRGFSILNNHPYHND